MRSERIDTQVPSALHLMDLTMPTKTEGESASENFPALNSCFGSRLDTSNIFIIPLLVTTARNLPFASRCIGRPSASVKRQCCHDGTARQISLLHIITNAVNMHCSCKAQLGERDGNVPIRFTPSSPSSREYTSTFLPLHSATVLPKTSNPAILIPASIDFL